MFYRTRPQSPHGVNRITGIWQWLQRRIIQTHHNHQFYPRRFHLRGVMIALLILFPALLWMRSVLKGSDEPTKRWALGACPPTPPVTPAQLVQTPERFQDRVVWVTGQLRMSHRVCAEQTCPKGHAKPCCLPCQARLVLRGKQAQVLLDGWLSAPNADSQRITCRGSTCGMSCAPLRPMQHYAMAGYVQVRWESSPHQRPRFTLRSFRVIRFCPLKRSIPTRYRRPHLPDPRYRPRN